LRRLENGALAINLIQGIVGSPEIFCPVKPRYRELGDVEPQHTEIMFADMDGLEVRIEADVDGCDLENERQIGTTRAFSGSRRNKLCEVTTIAIDR
jgi:hypothetical protein